MTASGDAEVQGRYRKPGKMTRARPWRGAIDRTAAYSPKHVGFATGLAGVLASPDKPVSVGLLAVGWAYDNVMTWLDRRNKKGDDNAD